MNPPNVLPNQFNSNLSTNQAMGKVSAVSSTEWEALLGSMEGGLNNVYDAIYGGGQGFIGDVTQAPATVKSGSNDWSPEPWDVNGFNLSDYPASNPAPQSVLSLSDESLSSGEDVALSDLGSLEYGRALSVNQSGADGLFVDFEGFQM